MENTMKPLFLQTMAVPSALGLCAITTAIFGCATAEPSRELVDARKAYAQAEASPAAQLQPAELLTARQALTKAEEAFKDDPGSETETHLAYLAHRKSQLAVADAEITAAKAAEDKAEAAYREQLEQGGSAELQRTKAELAAEREARIAAESKAASALKSLEQVATINETHRGTVITMSGAVLFPSGKEQLSASAKKSLDQVATVLINTPPERQLIIEGYTDSRGKDSYNANLSQKRADTVRTYLVGHGVRSEQITAVGKGEESPIADNETSDGRAANRRVEIIISKAGASAGATTPPAP
jgi:outer membrane protein OmpA-like peptidoglycan-associated protein